MDSGFSQGLVPSGRTMLIIVLTFASLLTLLVVGGHLTPGVTPSSAVALLSDGGAGWATAAVPPDQIYRRSVESVVKIEAFDFSAGRRVGAPGEAGSGFVVSRDGRIMTCAHVVSRSGAPATHVRVTFKAGLVGERTVEGVVIGIDTASDLAVVRIDPDRLTSAPLPLGVSRALHVGDAVYSIGNALDYDFSMTRGIVSALHRVLLGPNGATIREGIQTDAAVNPGDSGGPLLNAAGVVIGVNEQIATLGGVPAGNNGIAFAVPVDTVKDVLRQLEQTGRIVRPWVGVEALTISPAAVRILGLDVDRGILLVDVEAGGPAAAAGLRGGYRVVVVPGQPGRTVLAGGDVITSLDGREVSSTDDLVDCVQATRSGDTVVAEYVRDGRVCTARITVGVRPR